MKRGFTLIELLIVVAIIAILAAIAVPNFLEAQTRAKVSRVKADMRSAATALESYQIDWNCYPYCGYNATGVFAPPRYNYWYLPTDLTTPVAYITNVFFVDPFRQHLPPVPTTWQSNNLRYTNIEATWGTRFDSPYQGVSPTASAFYGDTLNEFGQWRINGAGPDRTYGPSGWPGISNYPSGSLPLPYDATNGTISDGDIIRTQKSATGYVNAST